MSTLSATLERQLMFPLPHSKDLRENDPIIPVTHPIYDYFASDNWEGQLQTSSKINKIIIAPVDISVDYAGYFKKIDKSKLTNAVTQKIEGSDASWQALKTDDSLEDVMSKLEMFVKGVAIAYTRDVTGESDFDVTSDTEPAGYDVFPVATGEAKLTVDEAKAYQSSTDAYNKLKAAYGDTNAPQMFDAMRIYYAFKYLDSMFSDPEDYFFIQRLVAAAKLIFVAQLFKMTGKVTLFDQVLAWMYHDSIQYATVDPTSNALEQKFDENGEPLPRTRGDNFALDDMFRRNVELSHDVKDNSKHLMDTKELVSGARDNLQSLENSDDLVKAQQRNSTIIYFVAITMLVLQIAALLTAEYLQNPLMGYLVIVVFAIVVLGIEATKGLNALVNL